MESCGICFLVWFFFFVLFFNLAALKAALCPLPFKFNLGSFLVDFFLYWPDLGLLL